MIKKISLALSVMILSSTTFAAENSPNWLGFYAGVNAGGVFNDVKLNSSHMGFTDMTGTCNSNANFSSFYPGVQLGYSYQYDDRVLFGVEGNYTYNINQSQNLRCICPDNNDVSDKFNFQNNQQLSVVWRMGYLLRDNIQPYIKLGGSVAQLGLNYSNEGGDRYSTLSNNFGWVVGTGIEWGFMQNWSVRAEYSYIDYGKTRLNIPTIYGLNDATSFANAKLQTNSVSAAINYWF